MSEETNEVVHCVLCSVKDAGAVLLKFSSMGGQWHIKNLRGHACDHNPYEHGMWKTNKKICFLLHENGMIQYVDLKFCKDKGYDIEDSWDFLYLDDLYEEFMESD